MSVFFTTQNTNSVQVQQENACFKRVLKLTVKI